MKLILVMVMGLSISGLDCPYQGDAVETSTALTRCFRNLLKPQTSEGEFVHCLNSIATQTNPEVVSMAKDLFSRKTALRPCTKQFNDLLEWLSKFTKQKKEIILPPFDISELVVNQLKKQDAFCDEGTIPELESKIKSTMATTKHKRFPIFVYKNDDIVSTDILNVGNWDKDKTAACINTLQNYKKQKNVRDSRAIGFLDIGAHVGWYSLNMALAGFQVYAFEPMKENIYIFRKNLCLHPTLSILLFETALGEKPQNCTLISSRDNRGDGSIFCNEDIPRGAFTSSGKVNITRLDDYAEILASVVMVKSDVEGFESHLLKGGHKVLIEQNIPYIQTEFSKEMISQKGGDAKGFLQEFLNAGYKISTVSFEGPFLVTRSEIEALLFIGSTDLFLTHFLF